MKSKRRRHDSEFKAEAAKAKEAEQRGPPHLAPLDNLLSSTTDPLSARAAEKPTYCHDLHATALHPLGIHHEQIAFYHNGIRRRITDVHGCVLHPILAQTPTVPR
jgi:hypothetical protein